ncbi:MAG: hypothetical protein GX428_05650 [Candidatus Atribacteria bacterium]|nr:hypothetical protein [Candidatus Atribacteria bacterium]
MQGLQVGVGVGQVLQVGVGLHGVQGLQQVVQVGVGEQEVHGSQLVQAGVGVGEGFGVTVGVGVELPESLLRAFHKQPDIVSVSNNTETTRTIK